MNPKLLAFICLCILSLTMVAQDQNCNCCIVGKVFDNDTKDPIPFATVLVKDTNKYAQTNENGMFLIADVCPEQYTLILSILGYEQSEVSTQYAQGKISNYFLKAEISNLENVTVKGERAKEKGTETISQERITKQDLQSNPTQSLAQSIATVEGVTFASTGTNVQLPIIHGLSGNRILVLNNGLKHAFQNWGNEHAPEIDINAANSITVIKGAGGVRFGPEALSGVIIVDPNPLSLNNPFNGSVGTGYQTNGRGYNANFEIDKGSEKWSYFINGSYTRIGDRFAPGVDLTDAEKVNLGISGNGRTSPFVDLSNTGKEEGAFSLGARHKFDD